MPPAAHATQVAGCSGGPHCVAVILCRFLLSSVTCTSRLPFHFQCLGFLSVGLAWVFVNRILSL